MFVSPLPPLSPLIFVVSVLFSVQVLVINPNMIFFKKSRQVVRPGLDSLETQLLTDGRPFSCKLL